MNMPPVGRHPRYTFFVPLEDHLAVLRVNECGKRLGGQLLLGIPVHGNGGRIGIADHTILRHIDRDVGIPKQLSIGIIAFMRHDTEPFSRIIPE